MQGFPQPSGSRTWVKNSLISWYPGGLTSKTNKTSCVAVIEFFCFKILAGRTHSDPQHPPLPAKGHINAHLRR